MADPARTFTRRSALAATGALILAPRRLFAADDRVITVHKDPTCGCCSGWVEHLQNAGFDTRVVNTSDLDAVKRRLRVPDELAACHTAEISDYVIEGHVPADAVKRLLSERPNATGLAVPGMPIGSPGMEGGTPERYEVVLFAPDRRRTYMRYLGDRAL